MFFNWKKKLKNYFFWIVIKQFFSLSLFQSIEPGQQFTWDHSNLEVNKPKNRYANVIAYDHSRVVLSRVDGLPGSDYINANYCDGYRKQNAYLICLRQF